MMLALRKWLVRLLIGGCLLGSSSGGLAGAGPPPRANSWQASVPQEYWPTRPDVIETGDGLSVDWRVQASLVRVVSDADGTFGVQIPGYSQVSRPGAPQLPFDSVLIALPSDALPAFRIVLANETQLSASGKLALAPMPQGIQRDNAGRPIGGDFAPAPIATPASTDEPVALEPVGVVRGVHLARLVFYPVRLVDGQLDRSVRLRVTTHVQVSLTFARPASTRSDVASLDPLLAAVRSAVANPNQVIPLPQTESASRLKPTAAQPSSARFAIQVTTPGLTAITYDTLAGAGFPFATADPHNLHLARGGIEIAAEWDGNNDSIFQPGERLLFFADPRPSRWTNSDVYLIWQDSTPGLRMSSRSAAPTSLPTGVAWVDETTEVNALYTPDCFCGPIPAGRDGDHWTWDDLKRPNHALASYPINLPPAVNATEPATLTVWLIGYTDVTASPDHRVDVSLDGASLGRVEWNGKQAITATLPVTPGILHGGINHVTLTLPGLPGILVEGAWLDAFSIRYARDAEPAGASVRFGAVPAASPPGLTSTFPYQTYLPSVTSNYSGLAPAYQVALASPGPYRAYDVTDPDHPLRLTGLAVSGNTITLSDPAGGGSYRYAVTAEAGVQTPTALRPSPPLHTSGGLGADYVVIAPDELAPALGSLIAWRQSQGLTVAVESPQAIYDAYGDGRPDPLAIRAYLDHAYHTWTPRPTFVLLVGGGTFDPKRYRAGSPPTLIPPYLADVDPWAGETASDNRYVTLDGNDDLPDMLIGRLPVETLAEAQVVADKIVQYETNPFPYDWNKNVALVADDPDPGAGDFAAQSEIIATTFVTLPFTTQRIYYTPPSTTIPAIQQAVLNAWNVGGLIIQFTGHSSWQQWAAERFFHLDDLPALHNDRRWPIVVEMTCFTGAFQRPEPTLDAELLKRSGGGAVAVWGATGLGVSTGHDKLDKGFFRAVFSDTVNTLGQATLAGKLALAATGQNLDLLDTFTLLGDPALRPNRIVNLWTYQTYLPTVFRTN